MLQFTKSSTIVAKETPIVKIPANAARIDGRPDDYRVEILDRELRVCILKCSTRKYENGSPFWMEMKCDFASNFFYLNNCKYSKIDENTALLSRVDFVTVEARFETVDE